MAFQFHLIWVHGFALPYLSDNCQLVTDMGRRHLRSSDVYACVMPRTQSEISDWSFTVAGPQLLSPVTGDGVMLMWQSLQWIVTMQPLRWTGRLMVNLLGVDTEDESWVDHWVKERQCQVFVIAYQHSWSADSYLARSHQLEHAGRYCDGNHRLWTHRQASVDHSALRKLNHTENWVLSSKPIRNRPISASVKP